jgi:SAM-dependent methyltransferase
MSDPFYSDPELYDLVFAPGGYGPFYAGQARLAGGPVLELACGTGQLLVPLARGGARAVGLDLSAPMLAAARARAAAEAVEVRLVEGDMRAFDLGERFALVYVARNSLLHLATVDDFLACFACVRRHLLPGGAFVFDVFNPDVGILARAPGERVPLMRVAHPRRGEVRIEATSDYDAATQVNRATWYFSTGDEPDFLVAPLHLRSIFPQELPLLLAAGGMRLESRHGDLAGRAFGSGSRQQVCVCRPA